METEPQILFERFEPSQSLRDRVDAEIAKLDQIYDRITACRVAIRADSGPRQNAELYSVHIHLVLPGGHEVAVTRDPGRNFNHPYDIPNLVVQDAFKVATRQLREQVRKMRGEVKTSEGPPLATVIRLFPEQGYGFLETDDRREIFFHKAAVVNDEFEQLEVGDRVTYHESRGEQGPQASTVKTMDKHSLRAEAP